MKNEKYREGGAFVRRSRSNNRCSTDIRIIPQSANKINNKQKQQAKSFPSRINRSKAYYSVRLDAGISLCSLLHVFDPQ